MKIIQTLLVLCFAFIFMATPADGHEKRLMTNLEVANLETTHNKVKLIIAGVAQPNCTIQLHLTFVNDHLKFNDPYLSSNGANVSTDEQGNFEYTVEVSADTNEFSRSPVGNVYAICDELCVDEYDDHSAINSRRLWLYAGVVDNRFLLSGDPTEVRTATALTHRILRDVIDGRREKVDSEIMARYFANLWDGYDGKVSNIASSSTFTIIVEGQVVAPVPSDNAQGFVDQEWLPVPQIYVYLTWGTSDEFMTFWSPDDGKVYSTYADDEGNFRFEVELNYQPDPENPYFKNMRIAAVPAHHTRFVTDEDDGLFEPSASAYVEIEPGDDEVYVSLLSGTDVPNGNAIRGITRAAMFWKDWWTDFAPLEYEIDPQETATHYNLGDDKVTFIETPYVTTAYHEYGHYVHEKVAEIWGEWPDEGCDGANHDWQTVINDGCAMIEGFAEFASAATYMYWLGRENPLLRDPERGTGSNESAYHFPESGESLIPWVSWGDNEGAVASYIYNLWDDVRLRTSGSAPDYIGDNETAGWPCGYKPSDILFAMADVDDSRPYLGEFFRTFINSIRLRYPQTWRYHHEALGHMYGVYLLGWNSFDWGDNGRIASATPTQIDINIIYDGLLDNEQRLLSWDDNTGPISIDYSVIRDPSWGQGRESNISLNRNNEGGFFVYRKKLNGFTEARYPNQCESVPIVESWIDPSYTLIASVPADQTTYLDDELVAPGEYQYVVVAFKQATTSNPYTSMSIPKAYARITVNRRNIASTRLAT